MCGIAGIYFKKNTNADQLKKFEKLVEQMQHMRGPDKFSSLEVTPNLFLFQNMLSIIDVGNASQPMQDEKGVITYNGEVYNYRDLKYPDEHYNLHSDTEVLLKGLNREYIPFLTKTNSMFGFGYYNKASQILTICRDRIGIKPIYFIDTDEVFAFASTITPLAMFSAKRLNHTKLWHFYLNRAFQAPATIMDDIFELEAGSYIEFDTKNNTVAKSQKWWERQKIENIYTDENEVINTIEDLLKDAIKNRLVADVPVGLFLSGGVDSSLVAALTAQQSSNLNAFTVSFYDENFDESHYAKRVAKQYGINYNEIKVNANDFAGSIDKWIETQDDIVGDPSSLLMYKISQFASSLNYRVLLAGEGADELFAGYNSYKYFNWTKKLHQFGKFVPLKKQIAGFYKKDSKKYNFLYNALNKPVFYGTAMMFEPHLLAEMIPSFKNENPVKAYNIKSAMDLDIKDRLQNDILTRSDRPTSASSIELRVPFLAHQLVDYSAGISEELFMKDNVSKYLIKKLSLKYLDHDILYRKKVGFDLPLKSWVSNELRERLEHAIENSVQKDFINIDVIRRCFDLHIKNDIDYATKLWAFLCIELSYKYLSKI
ncbi:MAG: asparagine synthase (glutamine-hydrolyzing) [Ferruginibacter sp.]